MQRLLRDAAVSGAVEEGQCGGAGLRARRLIQCGVDDDGRAVHRSPCRRPRTGQPTRRLGAWDTLRELLAQARGASDSSSAPSAVALALVATLAAAHSSTLYLAVRARRSGADAGIAQARRFARQAPS